MFLFCAWVFRLICGWILLNIHVSWDLLANKKAVFVKKLWRNATFVASVSACRKQVRSVKSSKSHFVGLYTETRITDTLLHKMPSVPQSTNGTKTCSLNCEAQSPFRWGKQKLTKKLMPLRDLTLIKLHEHLFFAFPSLGQKVKTSPYKTPHFMVLDENFCPRREY